MQRTYERRFEIGGKVEVADMKSRFDLGQGKALFIAKVEGPF